MPLTLLYNLNNSVMIASAPTMHSLERVIRKTVEKLPTHADDPVLTDLYMKVNPECGEVRVYNDEEQEITRCVVEEWINNTSESFFQDIQPILQEAIHRQLDRIEQANLLRPYSFVLIDEEGETIADLYLVDDEQIIVSHELMAGLSEELDAFWEELERK